MPQNDTIAVRLREFEPEIRVLRQDIHSHPELGFEETRTAGLVASRLSEWGYDVHEGIGRTGVVGVLRSGNGKRRVGLRADIDALPIHETTGLAYASRTPGKMHACGHDGHTAMLLAAARYLGETHNFDGTLNLIFQPAEEGQGGALAMLEDGLLERFPCDALFGMHNMPGIPEGHFGFRVGPYMASQDTIIATIGGVGGHGSAPHLTVDPVVAAASAVMALQTVVARNVDPQQTAVVSVGALQAGEAHNVIPGQAVLRISIRTLDRGVRDLVVGRVKSIIEAQAACYGCSVEIEHDPSYPVLVNSEAETAFASRVAIGQVGEAEVDVNTRPLTASEDFGWMLERVPGCYCVIGNGTGENRPYVHNSGYDFNDNIIVRGAAYWVGLAEAWLAPERKT